MSSVGAPASCDQTPPAYMRMLNTVSVTAAHVRTVPHTNPTGNCKLEEKHSFQLVGAGYLTLQKHKWQFGAPLL